MIISITFQFTYNKNYLNKDIQKFFPLGDKYTTDLEQYLLDDITFLQSIHSLIADLNKDLSTTKIKEKIAEHIGGHEPRITTKTKTKRSYFIGGLTIHEEDNFQLC